MSTNSKLKRAAANMIQLMGFAHDDREEYMHKMCLLIDEHFKSNSRISAIALYEISKKAFCEIDISRLENEIRELKSKLKSD